MLEPAYTLIHTDMMLIDLGSGFKGISGRRIGLACNTGITRCSGPICSSKLNKDNMGQILFSVNSLHEPMVGVGMLGQEKV